MKLRIILLFLALIIGAAAVFGVIVYINGMRASMEEEIEKVEVLVAAINIPKEMPVEVLAEGNMVEIKGVPRKYIAEGALTSLDGYEGYVAANNINEGEQITTTKFAKLEEMGLVFVIPDGMVAVSIPIDEVIGVSNLINVGDRVNVIATFFPGQTASDDEEQVEGTGIEGEELTEEIYESGESSIEIEKELTKTLLWNVEVLYVGTREVTSSPDGNGELFGVQTRTESASKEISTVTLAVTPEDSERMVFSEEMGSVWLALVPVDGIEKEDTPGRTLDNIFD
ncbi:MAG: Flp pilus assembly protein CpaB [Actinomycetota bacterium]|nr:Flp pilus assembly protein CpaB [Actinomycetota bacterium]